MENLKYFKDQLLSVNPDNFQDFAIKLFRFQAQNNPVYSKYLKYLQVDPLVISDIHKIPFLPIGFFKSQTVLSTKPSDKVLIFESSGTTGEKPSRHFLPDLDLYHQVTLDFFQRIYGRISDYHIFALLPSYLERRNASLVSMVDYFISQTHSSFSGFYLHNHEEMLFNITEAKKTRKVLLIGVSFALLDLAENLTPDLENIIVMETGGMKGRRKEVTRDELHQLLKGKLHVQQIHSEYGMTELMSQAYSQGDGVFTAPPWMKILIRDVNDPFDIYALSENMDRVSGGINVIDLANIHSCAFIETQDLGRKRRENDKFEVLGRFDNSDIRGCNLMVN